MIRKYLKGGIKLHSIILTIRDCTKFSDSEQTIADYVLKNTLKITQMRSEEVAKNTYTSTSTVARFCKKINCANYREFVLKLASELKSFSDIQLGIVEDTCINEDDSLESIISKTNQLVIDAIKETSMMNQIEYIEKVIDMIDNASDIDIYAYDYSLLVAQDIYYKLNHLGRNVRLNTFPSLQ